MSVKKYKSIDSFLIFALLFSVTALIFSSMGIIYSQKILPTVIEVTSSPQKTHRFPSVVIDPGHGGEDGGASDYGGLPEKELNLLISNNLRDMLEAIGFNVVMTRTEDTLLYDKNSDYHGHKKSMDLANRLKIARETDNAVLISIHMNAFPETQYSGLQVYYSKNNTGSQSLAHMIQESNQSFIAPQNERKIKKAGSNIYLLDRFDGPAVLIECGFLSNDDERKMLNTSEYRQKLSACFLSSVMKYLSVIENNTK